MKQTVKDVINQLEKLNPNETVFALIYTKDDVKELEHYDPITGQIVYPYNDEVIIGTVKYAGYLKKRTKSERTKLLKEVWKDIVTMFGDKKIICPSGTYFDYIHLCINQKRAPHEAYYKRLMQRNGFIREGDYWIRNANLLA